METQMWRRSSCWLLSGVIKKGLGHTERPPEARWRSSEKSATLHGAPRSRQTAPFNLLQRETLKWDQPNCRGIAQTICECGRDTLDGVCDEVLSFLGCLNSKVMLSGKPTWSLQSGGGTSGDHVDTLAAQAQSTRACDQTPKLSII